MAPMTMAQRANNGYHNLLSAFWVGDINTGQFVSRSPYQGGKVTPTTPAQPTSTNPWEYAQAHNAVYAMWKSSNPLNGDAGWRVGTQVRSLRSKFPDSTWETVGNTGDLMAVDDCAWVCLMFLGYADCTHDKSVLPIVAAIINVALSRWLDNTTGGGLWYSDARTEKSSYQAALVFAMLWYDHLNGSTTYNAQALSIYNWAIKTLYRSDGGWWEGVGRNGAPIGIATPYAIQPGSSVTYLAGNMFWSCVGAALNSLWPSPSYASRANSTAAFMLKYETVNGHWMNDRDPSTDAAGAYFYIEYVLPTLTSANQAAIKVAYSATATAIDPNATNTFAQFSADWQAGSFLGCTAAPNDACNNTPVFANDVIWAIVAQQF